MAKRLQMILQDADYREIRRIARVRGMSIAQWVRSLRGFHKPIQ